MERANLLTSLPVIHDTLAERPFGYAVVGGVVTDALLMDDTIIDPTHHAVYVEPNRTIGTLRDNATYKDVDLRVFTIDHDEMRSSLVDLNSRIENTFPHTRISVSGYESEQRDTNPVQLITQIIKQNTTSLYLSMGDVRHEIPASDIEGTWLLYYRDDVVNIYHPVTHIESYKVRSIAGTRPKDRHKVARLEEKVREVMPLEGDAIHKAWSHYAQTVSEYYSVKESLAHPTPRRLIMALGKLGLGAVERTPWLVTLAQDDKSAFSKLAHKILAQSQPSYYTGSIKV